jgi:hypothetical protein
MRGAVSRCVLPQRVFKEALELANAAAKPTAPPTRDSAPASTSASPSPSMRQPSHSTSCRPASSLRRQRWDGRLVGERPSSTNAPSSSICRPMITQ